MPYYFEIQGIKVEVIARTSSSLLPFYHLAFNCDLDPQRTEQMFQTALLLLKKNNYANLF